MSIFMYCLGVGLSICLILRLINKIFNSILLFDVILCCIFSLTSWISVLAVSVVYLFYLIVCNKILKIKESNEAKSN
jgi:hypothetical protein